MKNVSVSEFKCKCVRLMEQVRVSGERLEVTRHGRPVAIISPPPTESSEIDWSYGACADTVISAGDLIEPVM